AVFAAAVGKEAEDAVAAIEAAGRGEQRAVVSRRRQRQRRGVGEDDGGIGDGDQRVRRGAEALLVLRQDGLVAGIVERRIDGAGQRRRRENLRIAVPVGRAD